MDRVELGGRPEAGAAAVFAFGNNVLFPLFGNVQVVTLNGEFPHHIVNFLY